MPNNPTVFLIMLAAVAFLISLSKGGLGGMAGTLSTPLMALVMPVNQVLGLLLPIMLVADVFAIALHWRKWNGRLVWLLIPGAVIGVTIGTYFIANVSTNVLKIGLAIIALLFVAYKVLEKRILGSLKYQERNWHGWLAGTTAGFTSAMAHSGVPPISIYLMLQDVSPSVFIATSVLFYAILNWIKVPFYFFTGLFDFQRLWQISWVFPIVPFGVWIGRWLVTKVSKKIFDNIILVLLVVTALLLIFG
ncbi:MAG: sulfite exporter TauE/SafE family protein [Chloroflexi bacterium]|nr:sulfite exporter TauE/SafE family protein [Chloroflexota bacterium]